jgi:hypothetical protein
MRLPIPILRFVLITSISSPALAFECTNAGAGSTAPNDFGSSYRTACGDGSEAAGSYATAVGGDAIASGADAIALGESSEASGDGSMALGNYSTATENFGSAIGWDANAMFTNSAAIGAQAQVDQANAMVLGSIPGFRLASNYVNVGIGTTTPAQALDVERSATAARFQLSSFTSTANEAPQYIQRRARGTVAAPVAMLANDNLGLFSFRGYNGTVMGGSRATITAQAAGNFTNSSTPTRLIFATTPVGQTVPQQVLVITPDGKVQVNGQNLNVPDYVFEDDYPLMPLDELQSFIDVNGHLPGIAPAHEVNANGLDLAGSQMDLLQKVEELTLYTLQQEAELRELRTLREEVAELRSLLAAVNQRSATVQ